VAVCPIVGGVCVDAVGAKVYQGEGYHFDLPHSRGKDFLAQRRALGPLEEVFLLPPGEGDRFEEATRAPPSSFAELKLIKVEIRPYGAGLAPTLEELQKREGEELRGKSMRFSTTRLKVLKMPGVFLSVASPKPFVRFLLRGKKGVYTVTAGLPSRRVLALVSSLGEGRASDEDVFRSKMSRLRAEAGDNNSWRERVDPMMREREERELGLFIRTFIEEQERAVSPGPPGARPPTRSR